MVPGWDGSHKVAPSRTQQKLENHHRGIRARGVLESSGLPHVTTVAERRAGPGSHGHRGIGRQSWKKHPELLALLQAGLCLLNGTLLHVFPQPNWGGLSTQPRPLPARPLLCFSQDGLLPSHPHHSSIPSPTGIQACLAPFSAFSMFISKWQDSAIGLGILCVLHEDKGLKLKMCEFKFGQPELPPPHIKWAVCRGPSTG